MPRVISHAATTSSYELTRDDFLRLFALGREIHINLSPEDSVYQMNIGFSDLDNAQVWQLPDIPFEGPSIWTITDPTTTPHSSLFAEATHALVSTNDQIAEGTVYVYYDVAETKLVQLGEVVEPLNAQPPETYRYDYALALFPMNRGMGFITENVQPYPYDDFDVNVTHEVRMHGFGTFILNDQETLEAGTFIDDIVYRDPNAADPDEIFDFETVYSIFSTDGSLFAFSIADPPTGDSTAVDGDVYISYVDYWRVLDPTSTSIEVDTPPEDRPWSVYPNPASDAIRFSKPMSVSLYDVLGRKVGTGTSVQHLDVSGLPPGLYLVRSESGQSKTLIIR